MALLPQDERLARPCAALTRVPSPERFAGDYVLLHRGGDPDREVWQARQIAMDRPVAIEMLPRDLASRFERETEALTAIDHDGLVEILDWGRTDDGAPYHVTELLRGQTLEALIEKQGPLPWHSARQLTLEVGDALARLHAHGVVHGDVRPRTVVLLDPAPIGASTTKLVGFGHADADADTTTDVRGLGALLVYLLTGHRPEREPTPFAELVPGLPIPEPVETLAFDALSGDVADVPTVAEALASVPADANAEDSMLGPSFAKYGSSKRHVDAILEDIRADEAADHRGESSGASVTTIVLVLSGLLVLTSIAALAWTLGS